MSLGQDVHYAVRLCVRNPAFSIVVVLTLALGIGANTAMFSILEEVLVKPLPYREPERLVLGSTTFGGEINPWTSSPDYYDVRDQSASFESLAATAILTRRLIVAGNERPEFVAEMFVSANFFRTLGVEPVAGRWFSNEEGKTGAPYVAVVSQSLAEHRFGGAPQALGKQLTLSGIAKTTVVANVVGVMPRSFRWLDEADVWTPMRAGEDDGPETRQFHNWIMVGRLRPGSSVRMAQREVDVIAERLRRLYPVSNEQKGFLIEPLRAGLLRAQMPQIIILGLAVGLMLLIACANVGGLLLARGAVRKPEIAIRAALGASRGRVVTQLLVEASMLALLAGAGGIAVALWLQRLLPIATGLVGLGVAPRHLEWPVLLFAFIVSAVTALLFGLIPALWITSSNTGAAALAHGTRTTGRAGGTRPLGVLVVAQVAISMVLMLAAGLLVRSFTRLVNTNPGFDPKNLVTGEIQLPNSYPPEKRLQLYEMLRRDFASVPGVTAVGFIDRMPIRQRYGNLPVWDVKHPPDNPSLRQSAYTRLVLPGYFDALRIPLLAGRDIAEADRVGAVPVMVINERMANTLFSGQKALGQHVMAILTPLGGESSLPIEVVGVVGNARIDALSEPGRMTMYLSCLQYPPRPTMRFAVRTRLPLDALSSALRKHLALRDPDLPFANLVRMEEVIGDSLLSQRVTFITLVLFAAIAMLLAGIGLYGTLTYWVNQRTHDIGVRLALGAGKRDILRLIIGHGTRLAAVGAGIGLVASLAMTRWMQSMMYGISPYDPLTFATVIAFLVLIAAAACYLPAQRAIHVDPIATLRAE